MPHQEEPSSGERQVGIRELKSRLSRYLRDIKAGATVVVTERGSPVARLVPEAVSPEKRLQALRDSGAIVWSGRRLGTAEPEARALEGVDVADILVEDRR
ncbi:MAG: type II toxin-antitoxin system prevent-host-death family antitoxin [Acidobacteria bacterium]|nr:type II toxin-antitoxin system prevent-host-death family antitoxin [Acidobacteriota bacterium]